MALICLCIAQLAFAVEQDYQFRSLQVQHRYEKLIKEIRCAVCQNQSLFDSSSTVAKNMRKQVYLMLNSGMSDRDVREYFCNLYGDAILFMPPWGIGTFLLWAGPFFMLVFAFIVFRSFVLPNKVVQSQHAC